jgi:hypothetical protein
MNRVRGFSILVSVVIAGTVAAAGLGLMVRVFAFTAGF